MVELGVGPWCDAVEMSETVWVALITGAFTLGSGTLAVWLTHRYSRHQAEATRREDRRREVRVLLAEFVNAGVGWASSHQNLVPTYARVGSDQQFWIEWPKTDSGRQLLEHALAVDRSGGELRLLVGDSQLLDLMNRALELKADGSALADLISKSSGRSAASSTQDEERAAFLHYVATEQAFRAVEERAAQLLRGDL